MKKITAIFLLSIMLLSFAAGCSQSAASKIEGVDDDVYKRGIEFMAYMDKTKMIGEKEGLDMLNAISPEGRPDSDALFEDVIYILWIYHNLKSVDTAAEELNRQWQALGDNRKIQDQYDSIRSSILSARTQQDLQHIWNTAKKKNST